MSRNAIVTISVGPIWKALGNVTINTMIKYAHRIGADFININNSVVHKITKYDIRYEKFQIYDLLGIYDRIMLVDYDAVITKSCPDMFKVIPENKIGIKVAYGIERCEDFVKLAEQQLGNIDWGKHYYNSGVMIVSKAHRSLFEYQQSKVLTSGTLAEQNTIIYRIYRDQIPIQLLNLQQHYIPYLDGEVKNPFIIHWAGGGRGGREAIQKKIDGIISDVRGKYKELL